MHKPTIFFSHSSKDKEVELSRYVQSKKSQNLNFYDNALDLRSGA